MTAGGEKSIGIRRGTNKVVIVTPPEATREAPGDPGARIQERPISAAHASPSVTRRIKADLHLHTGEDPLDIVHHSASELLHRAHDMGFEALAITLHDHVFAQPEVFKRARELGILLIPSAEMRIEGGDVVLLNITEAEGAALHTFDDLAALKKRRGESLLIFAPHPFYVFGGSIGGRQLKKHIACFDAVEYCHFHTAGWNLNTSACHLAAQHAKPLLATSDTHRLDFFGDHYSLIEIDGELDARSLFQSIRAGRIRLVSPAWPWKRLVRYLFYIFFTHRIQCLIDKLSR